MGRPGRAAVRGRSVDGFSTDGDAWHDFRPNFWYPELPDDGPNARNATFRTMNKQRTEWIAYLWRRGLLLVVALFMLNSRAHADGGIVALHQVASPFVVTVFSAPVPLRVGPVDISALVQDRANGQPVLDGEIFIRLRKQGGMAVGGRATREVAQNKLLYSALMNLP